MDYKGKRMKKFYWKLLVFSVFCFCFVFNGVMLAQSGPSDGKNQSKSTLNATDAFEGSIYFIQETKGDTLYYTYHIKNNLVRLDIHEGCKNCSIPDNYMVFDISKGTIIAVKPSRKMYITVPPKPYVASTDEQYQIIKTKNNKKIQGYKCYQWRVRNKAQNTEIAYWVAEDHFYFFDEFLKLWNRSEKHAVYFLQISDSDGFFPMLSEERTTLREQKMTLKVLRIEKKPLEMSLFQLPKDYKSYEN